MSRENRENSFYSSLLRQLCEAETGGDPMICHDGGFRYSGDFMTMESEIVESAAILDDETQRALFERGLIESVPGQPGAFRVTERGRALAYDA